MNRAIVVLAQIGDLNVRRGSWIIDGYSQEAIAEGQIQRNKYYYITFKRLTTGLPFDISEYAMNHNIELEPSAIILTTAQQHLYCYRLD